MKLHVTKYNIVRNRLHNVFEFFLVCGFAEWWMCVRVRWKWGVFGMRTEYVMYEKCLVID